MRRPLLCLVLACSLLLTSGNGGQAKTAPPPEFDTDRNRLIAFILSQQLPAQHFSHEPLGDELSRKMFDLYLRQLDPRKRFLLQADVRQLNAFAPHVDDELKQGKLVLPDAGRELLNDRIRLVQRIGAEKVVWLEGLHPACKYTVEEIKAIKAEYRAKTRKLKEKAA